MRIITVLCVMSLFSCAGYAADNVSVKYPVVDTGQIGFYNSSSEIATPGRGMPYYGQDAQYSGHQPSYKDNRDGTITDNVTGLVWEKSYVVMSLPQALERLETFRLVGKSDWRLPTIKELYSLIDFSGRDFSPDASSGSSSMGVPFIDSEYFDFDYGSNGRRPIDVQLLSSTIYTGTTMDGQKTVFGLNVADGRIKGYPITDPRTGGDKEFTVRFVRGNPEYGENDFVDNNDGTVSDMATGLMWQKGDSKTGMNWEDALNWVMQKNRENYLGYNDWRLPNAKELQSIVDYSRSPYETDSAAIDPVFNISSISNEVGEKDYPFFWSSTTHLRNSGRGGKARNAVYLSFGEASGFFSKPGRGGEMNGRGGGMPDRGGDMHDRGMQGGMRPPPEHRFGERGGRPEGRRPGRGGHPPARNESRGSGTGGEFMDVHGAGAQRSDPKAGSAADYPYGLGPQGDVIRVDNYVRMVRDID